MTPIEWLMSDDTGISSMTICAVMTRSEPPRWAHVPRDPADFGRCFRLLAAFPSWRHRMHEVVHHYREWGPLVREWDALSALYVEEEPTGKAPRLYKRMRELIDEGRQPAMEGAG